VLAAGITNISTDSSQLDPMVTATHGELERAAIDEPPEVVAADAGYWNEQHMDEVVPTSTSRCWSRPTRAPAAPPSAG
jgi:hypothetical protein